MQFVFAERLSEAKAHATLANVTKRINIVLFDQVWHTPMFDVQAACLLPIPTSSAACRATASCPLRCSHLTRSPALCVLTCAQERTASAGQAPAYVPAPGQHFFCDQLSMVAAVGIPCNAACRRNQTSLLAGSAWTSCRPT